MHRIFNLTLAGSLCLMFCFLLRCGDDNTTKATVTPDLIKGTWRTDGGVPAPGGKGDFWAVMSFTNTDFYIGIVYRHLPDTSIKDSVHMETGTWSLVKDSVKMNREVCRQKDTNTQIIDTIPCGADVASLPVPTSTVSWDIPISAIAVYLQSFLQNITLPDGTVTLMKDK